MLNKVYGKKLNRSRNSRKALFRSLVRSMVEHGYVKTTRARARAAQPLADRLMLKARAGDLAARRQAVSLMGNDKQTVDTVFNTFKKLSASRNSGFTKFTRLPARRGDNVNMVKMEWVVGRDALAPTKTKKKENKKETETKKK